MAEQPKPIRLEEVDWQAVFPWLVIFRSFRMAVQPAKMVLALALVVLTFFGATLLDMVSGQSASVAEIRAYTTLSADEFDTWLDTRADRHRTVGVFAAALEFKFEAAQRMARSAVTFNFGLGDLLRARRAQGGATLVAALYDLMVTLPRWLLGRHPWMLMLYSVWGLVIWAYFGGAIARLAALDAAGGDSGRLSQAIAFSRSRYVWFLMTPVLPGIVVGLLAIALAIAGFLLSVPLVNIVVGAVFVLAILIGFLIAIILVLLAGGFTLLFPAIAVEDADAFDAISRAFSYVLGRPWRWLFYNGVGLVYGALTYLTMTVLMFLSIAAVYHCMRVGAMDKAVFDAMLPPPRADGLRFELNWADTAGTARLAALFVWVWVTLAVSLLAAFVASFHACAATWVYLLLRKSADGNELNDIYTEPAVATES